MSRVVVSSAARPHFFFDREQLRALAAEQRTAYREARPYPHVVLDGFLGDELARSLARSFPGPEHHGWIRRDYPEQSGRMGQLQRSNFDGIDFSLRQLLAELSGMAFLDFLGALTDIDGLIPDPHFRGAGPSLTLPGGHLALHADFNRDRTRHLARAVTVLYYLSADWDDSWGGALELWNEERTQREARYAPVLDRLVVMAHGDRFWHGHPAPLACPADRYRASVAAYYYVASASSEDADAHGAIWA
ncbi:MAG: hypothetical protein K0S65_4358 [Labilithrix sp.]|nr:hypothetical protein [Labilithrix sp.]